MGALATQATVFPDLYVLVATPRCFGYFLTDLRCGPLLNGNVGLSQCFAAGVGSSQCCLAVSTVVVQSPADSLFGHAWFEVCSYSWSPWYFVECAGRCVGCLLNVFAIPATHGSRKGSTSWS